MNNIGDFLENEVYPRLDRAVVFADLGPVQRHNKYIVKCPACGKREAYIYADKWRLHCGREGACGYTVGLLQYIAGTQQSPRGMDFVNAARLLASMAGVCWEERKRTVEDLEVIARAQEREQQLELFLNSCQGHTDESRAYLVSRGFRADAIPSDLGFCQSHRLGYLQRAPELLAGKPGITDGEIWTLAERWVNRVVAPIRDRKGRLRGVFGRDITGKAEQKYLYTAGVPFDKIGLVGLDVALANNNRDITIWEAGWDVFSLRAQGYNAGTGIGGSLSKLTPECWGLLGTFGIRSVTLWTDNDDAGRKGLATALDNADRCMAGHPEIYVIDPATMRAKDPDEHMRRFSMESFNEVLASAVHAYRFRARVLASGVDFTTDKSRDAYLESCVSFDSKFTDKRKIQKLAENFWTEVTKIVPDADMDCLLDLRDDMRVRSIKAQESSAISELVRQVSGKVAEGDISGAKSVLSAGVDRIKLIETKPVMEPLRTVAEEIDDHYDRWERSVGKDYLGLRSGQEILDSSLFGLRGLGLFGARSNVGKTTELCGLTLGILLNHPEACVAFYSIEMSRSEIVDKLACYLSRTDWTGLRTDKALAGSRLDARRELRRLGDRLLILDRDNNPGIHAEKMIRQISQHKSNSECDRVAVFIDYLDVIEIDENNKFGANERLIEKEQVKIVQAVSDSIGKENPIIAISEVRKGRGDPNDPITIEDLSGSNRKGYAADWALVMNPMSDKQLVENFQYLEYIGQGNEPVVKPWGERKIYGEKELKEAITKAPLIREWHSEKGKAFGQLELVKARDGSRRHKWNYTNWYNQSRIEEGIN